MTDIPKHHRQKDLLAYAQDFLEPDEKRELEEHLKGCADCQATLEEVRSFLPAVREALAPPQVSTEELWESAQRAFRRKQAAKAETKQPFFTWVRVALLAGGAAVAATILVLIQPFQHHPRQRVYYAPRPPGAVLVRDAGPDAGPPTDAGLAP